MGKRHRLAGFSVPTAGKGRAVELDGIVATLGSAREPLSVATIASRTGGTRSRTGRLLVALRHLGRARWVPEAAGWALPSHSGSGSPRRRGPAVRR